jgi:hypothetical protein
MKIVKTKVEFRQLLNKNNIATLQTMVNVSTVGALIAQLKIHVLYHVSVQEVSDSFILSVLRTG